MLLWTWVEAGLALRRQQRQAVLLACFPAVSEMCLSVNTAEGACPYPVGLSQVGCV